jgi:DNA-binding beta-propeller fold protein YncE
MKTRIQSLLGIVLLANAVAVRGATLTLFVGGGTNIAGRATESRLADPFAVGFDASRVAYICEMTNNRLVMVHPRGFLSPFAGTTRKGNAGDGGPALTAEFNGPHNLIVARNGDIFIADTWNWKVRIIDEKSKNISTFAGTGKRGYRGDGGPATNADFSGIYSLAFDAAQENLYLADLENRRVRAINLRTAQVRLVAGNGEKGIPPDGSAALTSPLFDPRAVAVAKSGDVYILERSGNALRVVDTKGKIRTVVGTAKPGGLTDSENPREATLKGPKHLCVDKDDNVLIADSDNHVIRKYLPRENKLVRVAGTGKAGKALSDDPLKTELNQPHGVSVDGQGRIYIADSSNGRVLKIEN